MGRPGSAVPLCLTPGCVACRGDETWETRLRAPSPPHHRPHAARLEYRWTSNKRTVQNRQQQQHRIICTPCSTWRKVDPVRCTFQREHAIGGFQTPTQSFAAASAFIESHTWLPRTRTRTRPWLALFCPATAHVDNEPRRVNQRHTASRASWFKR